MRPTGSTAPRYYVNRSKQRRGSATRHGKTPPSHLPGLRIAGTALRAAR
ncbi:hypothetical protein AB0K86_28190 [Streptomyces clavifer]|nr:hypothetical protein [Streptomyces sp. Root55]